MYEFVPLVLGRVYVDRLLRELLREFDTLTGGRAYELADLVVVLATLLLRLLGLFALLLFAILAWFDALIPEDLVSAFPARALFRPVRELLPEVIADFVAAPSSPEPLRDEYIL